jgi:hypothetical protein
VTHGQPASPASPPPVPQVISAPVRAVVRRVRTSARHPRSPAALWRAFLSRRRTRWLLIAHLLAAALCALIAVIALLASCNRIQDGGRALAGRDAPAVQGLAAARLAVLRADREARALREPGFVAIVGSGETYRSQLSAADQGLSRIADRTDQDLGTVHGLFSSYRQSVILATTVYSEEELMREQKLREASSLLTRDGAGLVPRMDQIQRAQMRHAAAAVGLGRWQRAVWWLAELALAALVLTLLSALSVLRDRCGRDWNPYLLAALVFAVLLAVVPLRTMFTAQHHLDRAVGDLRQITEDSRKDTRLHDPAEAQEDVTTGSERVRAELADGTRPDWVFAGAFGGGLLVVLLPVAGLGVRLDQDYWRRR